MGNYETLNELLVTLFRDVMDIEQKVIITPEFKDITNNDMHVIEAIGSIIIFVIYGKEMRQYHRTNRSIPDTYFGWAAPTFIIFVVANAAFAIISFVGAMMG